MKFLLDAQLPYKLAEILRELGFDTLHTFDLPQQNTTSDSEIIRLVTPGGRVVVSKDTDFLQSYLVKQQPQKLLLITTGNIKNNMLLSLFRQNIGSIVQLLEVHQVLELNTEAIIVHY